MAEVFCDIIIVMNKVMRGAIIKIIYRRTLSIFSPLELALNAFHIFYLIEIHFHATEI